MGALVGRLSGLAAVLVLVLWGAGAQAAEASFDCAKAQAPVEKLICGNDDLAALDKAMGEAYRAAREAAPERKDTLQREQRAWAKMRDAACPVTLETLSSSYEVEQSADCLTKWTGERTTALQTSMNAGHQPQAAEVADAGPQDAANPVFQIQYGLRLLGFYQGPVNGLAGKATKEAIAAYAEKAKVDAADEDAVLAQLQTDVQAWVHPSTPAFKDKAQACQALVKAAEVLSTADLCHTIQGVGVAPDFDCAKIGPVLTAKGGKPDAAAKAIWDETLAAIAKLTRYPWVKGAGTCS